MRTRYRGGSRCRSFLAGAAASELLSASLLPPVDDGRSESRLQHGVPRDELLQRLAHPPVRAPVHHLLHRCLLFHSIASARSDDMFYKYYALVLCISLQQKES